MINMETVCYSGSRAYWVDGDTAKQACAPTSHIYTCLPHTFSILCTFIYNSIKLCHVFMFLEENLLYVTVCIGSHCISDYRPHHNCPHQGCGLFTNSPPYICFSAVSTKSMHVAVCDCIKYVFLRITVPT